MSSDVLRPLVADRKKRPYLVFDLESKDGEDDGAGDLYCSTIDRVERRTQRPGFTRPFLCGIYDGSDYFQFSGPDCLLSALGFILSKKYRGYYIYAHNGGRFDFLHLLPLLRLTGRSFELLTVGSSIQLLSVNEPGSARAPWRFVDSYRLIPVSLKAATEAFKTTRKLASHDLSLHEDDPSWAEYQKVDCISLYEVLKKYHELVEDKLGGEVGITAAATSMRTFRRAYLRSPIKRHTEHHEFVRRAYYGGRVEIHRKQAEGLRYYDINSCYPYVMMGEIPTGDAQTWEGTPTAHQRRKMVGFARASVRVPESDPLPVLPVRANSGRLIFPVGEFEGVWSSAELIRAEERGARVTWHESVWFETSKALEHFTLDLYSYRDRSRADYDESLAFIAKILLNSLYGKFGMKTDKEKLVVIGPDEEPPEGAIPNTDEPDCRVWRVPQEVDAPYIIPQIAAHITAKARLHLHHYAEIALSRGILAYMDTDSIITSADMSDYCGTSLGALKDEGAGRLYSGIFLQPKVYLLTAGDGSTKVAMKGYRERTADAFRRLQRGESLSYQLLEKVGTMARRGFKNGPLMRTVVRQARTEDEKRIYLEDGSTRPLVYNSKQGNK